MQRGDERWEVVCPLFSSSSLFHVVLYYRYPSKWRCFVSLFGCFILFFTIFITLESTSTGAIFNVRGVSTQQCWLVNKRGRTVLDLYEESRVGGPGMYSIMSLGVIRLDYTGACIGLWNRNMGGGLWHFRPTYTNKKQVKMERSCMQHGKFEFPKNEDR